MSFGFNYNRNNGFTCLQGFLVSTNLDLYANRKTRNKNKSKQILRLCKKNVRESKDEIIIFLIYNSTKSTIRRNTQNMLKPALLIFVFLLLLL